jgi:hypothetical protein
MHDADVQGVDVREWIIVAGLIAGAAVCAAAERQWQTGVWLEIEVKRQLLDFGPGSSGFGPQRSSASMRAMADVCVYVIETDELRLELRDVVPMGRRSVDASIGQPVTFALEKNSVWVRSENGLEHKLRLTKKTAKQK